MKTKELIKMLQEVDPSGELECAIDGNIDIFTIFVSDAYWDGWLQILERDHSKDPYYNICGGIITGNGLKVNIKPLSIEDAIIDNIDLPVKIVGTSNEAKVQYEKSIEEWRNEAREIIKEVERMNKEKKDNEN